MSRTFELFLLYGGILAAGIAAPLVFDAYTFQFTVLWVMILFALTWDILGGQMGYNSLGNIAFFAARRARSFTPSRLNSRSTTRPGSPIRAA